MCIRDSSNSAPTLDISSSALGSERRKYWIKCPKMCIRDSKTTTLRCLAGIIPATTGHARIGGVDIAADPVAAKRQLAFIPDEPRLFEHLTVCLLYTSRCV